MDPASITELLTLPQKSVTFCRNLDQEELCFQQRLLKGGTKERRENQRGRKKRLYFLTDIMLEIATNYALIQFFEGRLKTNTSILKMVSMDIFYSKSYLPNINGKATYLCRSHLLNACYVSVLVVIICKTVAHNRHSANFKKQKLEVSS